jgi:hypothetical protein
MALSQCLKRQQALLRNLVGNPHRSYSQFAFLLLPDFLSNTGRVSLSNCLGDSSYKRQDEADRMQGRRI